jgi:copper homeostasis protein CutC
MEPRCEVPILVVRLKKIKNVLKELIEKSKKQIIVLGGGCRRDNIKRLV